MIYQKNTVLMATALGLIFLGGCQAAPEQGTQNYQTPSLAGSTQIIKTTPSPSATTATPLLPAKITGDMTVNEALSALAAQNTQQVSTDLKAALASGDYKQCATLSSQTDVATCESSLILNKAVLARDESMCDLATVDTVKERCHLAFTLPMFKLK
jgi:hypothetical protein